ncbi:MAG: hypothetical protein WC501_05445 [Candidatus Micrarchaeia archaeon]
MSYVKKIENTPPLKCPGKERFGIRTLGEDIGLWAEKRGTIKPDRVELGATDSENITYKKPKKRLNI